MYRTPDSPRVLTTLASAGVRGGPLHAHGPALLGSEGEQTAAAIERTAAERGVTAMVWDGDAPTTPEQVHRLARESDARLLVLEWQPAVAGGDPFARAVLAHPPCDILLIRPGALVEISELVVAIGAGPNAPMLAQLARAWSDAFGVPASLLHRVEDDADVPAGRKLCADLAPELSARVEVGRDLTNLLAEVAARTGFVAMGATEHIAVDRVATRTTAARLTTRGDATVVVGRVRPAPTGQTP